MTEPQWETLVNHIDEGLINITDRLPTPAGWIYRTTISFNGKLAVSMVFVPFVGGK